MSEEIFDVVNERDEVVGQAPRQEVHARGLWHRAVHVLVFNARGEIFLQKRSLKKDIAAGKWDSSASGHLDTGEAYDACAVREVREEIGLELYHPSLPPIGGEISPQQGSRPESLNQPVLSNVKTPGAFPPLRVGGVGGADGESPSPLWGEGGRRPDEVPRPNCSNARGVRCASPHLGFMAGGCKGECHSAARGIRLKRSPNKAVPTRTIVAPSSMAISKSPLMPMLNSGSARPSACSAWVLSSRSF